MFTQVDRAESPPRISVLWHFSSRLLAADHCSRIVSRDVGDRCLSAHLIIGILHQHCWHWDILQRYIVSVNCWSHVCYKWHTSTALPLTCLLSENNNFSHRNIAHRKWMKKREMTFSLARHYSSFLRVLKHIWNIIPSRMVRLNFMHISTLIIKISSIKFDISGHTVQCRL